MIADYGAARLCLQYCSHGHTFLAQFYTDQPKTQTVSQYWLHNRRAGISTRGVTVWSHTMKWGTPVTQWCKTKSYLKFCIFCVLCFTTVICTEISIIIMHWKLLQKCKFVIFSVTGTLKLQTVAVLTWVERYSSNLSKLMKLFREHIFYADLNKTVGEASPSWKKWGSASTQQGL